MATSETEICNSALIKLGVEPIADLDENTKQARLCKRQYPIIKQDVLRSHPWNFAMTRVELAATGNVPLFEFGFEFVLPADVLRVMKTDLNISPSITESPWKVEHNRSTGKKVLLANDSVINILYVRDITDVQLFDSNFAEALAFRLASDLAYPLIQSVSLAGQMFTLYQEQLKTARSYDAQESSLESVIADEWIVQRF